MTFETDLDYERLNSMSEEEFYTYIEDNFVSPNITYAEGFNFKKTCSIMKIICARILKIQPSREQWVFLLADCERLLCEACAGAGKTTMAQFRSVKEKLIHNVAGANILALAYNTHAVEDMKSRHNSIIQKINKLGLPELRRDKEICCYTFHSFCKSWVEEYLSDFGIVNKNGYLMSELERHEAMNLAITSYLKKAQRNVFITDVIIEALLSVYSYIAETLTQEDKEAWKMCPNISDLTEFSFDDIEAIFGMYNKWKQLKHKLDFTDLVDRMYTICCRPEVIRRIRANYQVFILDEYQDFTPSMLRVIKIILEGDESLGIPVFENSKLTCIGDGDQSIYGFRGTDPDNCIRFKDTFSSSHNLVRVTAMSDNRRCPEEIISYARSVIESNSRRINKPINSIKPGGNVNVIKYSSIGDEMQNIIQRLRRIPKEDLRDSCVCYRNQSSSLMLGLHLMMEGIPFRVVKGHKPLTDKFSQTLFDVLNMLSYPDVLSWADKALFKVVPKSTSFTRKSISELVEVQKERIKKCGDLKMFYELDFPASAYAINGFEEALKALEHARMLHRYNKPMNTYMPTIIKLVRKYYLDWQLNKSNQLTPEYIEYITKWFCQDKDYDTFIKEYHDMLNSMNDTDPNKITLTTFHGLKGLEFKNMFIIDLADLIFPGTELNQVKDLSSAQKDILECEARRLFYVALTRTKENLTLFFDANSPSRYIRFFMTNTGLADNYKDFIHEDKGFLVAQLTQSETLEDSSELDFSGLDDFDLEQPLISEVEPSPEESIRTAMNTTSFFDKLAQQEEEKESRLIAAFGQDKYEQIKGKSVISSILDRVCQEGKNK